MYQQSFAKCDNSNKKIQSNILKEIKLKSMKIKLNGNNKLILQTKIYQNKLNGNPEKSPLYSFSFSKNRKDIV